ncbi:hypothetical protein CISG_09350 [Coccidioides immitis RMSCC 3703]|uniref:Uncharacterized protein n=1 Tax=Coccidioides immitis RMSCC 3703 TaxID=454286 RepID=A0A0J8U4R0_COCIT|nr:hypothetical protein CISG_09350 [Coccidioides immitis RMSCC 3703]
MKKIKLPTIQAEISSLNNNLENLESTDNVSTVVSLWAIQQLIAKSEGRFKDNNPENIYRLLLLLKYTAGVKAAITTAIGKEFQGDVEIDSTNENIDADFKKDTNNAVKTINKIIYGISFDIPLSSMNKGMRKALLEEFTKNTVDIEMLFVEKHRSNNRLIADAKHLEYLEMSDNDDNNKDSIKNTGKALFKLNCMLNTTRAEALDYLTACSDLNMDPDNLMIANLTLKPWQVTEVAWKLTQELSSVENEILADEAELENTVQCCTLILKVKEQKSTELYYSTLIICLNKVVTN